MLDAAPAAKSGESPIVLDKRAICVHAGLFQSQDGEIGFDKARIQRMIDRNNAYINQLKREYAGAVPVGAYPPVYEDHTDNTRSTVGRLMGPFTYEERNIPKVGTQVPCMVAECVRFLGAENCERAADGRMFHVSIGVDEESNDLLTELSVVPEPAAPGAMLLSKGAPVKKFEIEEKDGMFLVKTDKGYIGSESYKTRELAQEAGEQYAKSCAELEEGEGEKAKAKKMNLSKEKKMAANKETFANIKRLAGEFKTAKTTLVKASGDLKHLAKKTKVEGELRKLVRMKKMTPAEFRLAKVDELARLDDSAVGHVLDAYRNRVNVIEAGQSGTTDALEAGKMAEEIGIKRLKSETKKELKRLGAKFKAGDKEEADEKKLGKDEDEKEDKKMSSGYGDAGTKELSKEDAEADKKLAAEAEVEVSTLAEAPQKKIAELEEQVGMLTSVVERLSAELDKICMAEEAEGHAELAADKEAEGEKELAKDPAAEEGEKKELSEGEGEKKEGEGEKKELAEGEKAEDEKKLAAEARKDMGLAEKKDESESKEEEKKE